MLIFVYRALFDCNGVDKKLLNDRWIENHYRHIVWKLATYERRYPEQYAGRSGSTGLDSASLFEIFFPFVKKM